jgi:hypothetical protein
LEPQLEPHGSQQLSPQLSPQGSQHAAGAPQVGPTLAQPHEGAGAQQVGAIIPQGAGAPHVGASQHEGSAQHEDFLENSFFKKPPRFGPQLGVSQLHQSQLVGAQPPQTTDGPQPPLPQPWFPNKPACALLLVKPTNPAATIAANKPLQLMGGLLFKFPQPRNEKAAAPSLSLALVISMVQGVGEERFLLLSAPFIGP